MSDFDCGITRIIINQDTFKMNNKFLTYSLVYYICPLHKLYSSLYFYPRIFLKKIYILKYTISTAKYTKALYLLIPFSLRILCLLHQSTINLLLIITEMKLYFARLKVQTEKRKEKKNRNANAPKVGFASNICISIHRKSTIWMKS